MNGCVCVCVCMYVCMYTSDEGDGAVDRVDDRRRRRRKLVWDCERDADSKAGDGDDVVH